MEFMQEFCDLSKQQEERNIVSTHFLGRIFEVLKFPQP